MKKLTTLVLIAISITAWSFINVSNQYIAGTYGVCNTNNTTVELKLNPDNSFRYIDNSNPKKTINVKGKWTMKKNRISLHDYSSQFKFHDNWKIDKEGIVANSRRGLSFYRLVNKNNCENS